MKTITIYSTPTCGFCKMLKAFLQSQSIPYTDKDVTVDQKALEEMQELAPGNMSVPLVIFNKGKADQEIQVGYDQEKVEKALGLS
jgi:glutaredoxin